MDGRREEVRQEDEDKTVRNKDWQQEELSATSTLLRRCFETSDGGMERQNTRRGTRARRAVDPGPRSGPRLTELVTAYMYISLLTNRQAQQMPRSCIPS